MTLHSLKAWYSTPLGRCVLQLEQEQISRWLKISPGSTIVQLGGVPESFNIAQHEHSDYVYLSSTLEDLQHSKVGVLAEYEELPFLKYSVDLMVVAHVLEFVEHPSVVLKEIFDCLAPNGKLLLFCFNAWSYWRLHKFFVRRLHFPWQGTFLPPPKLQHWAQMIGYNNLNDKTLCFRLPFIRRPRSRISHFIEVLGQITFPVLGAVNVFLLEKRMLGPSPVRQVIWKETPIINPGMVEPTSRVNKVIKNE